MLIRKKFKHSSPSVKAIFIFISFIALAFLLPIKKEIPFDVDGILSATSIFYSILLGFYIASSMTNLSRLKSLVAAETGALIAIYNIVKISLPERLEKTKKAIDDYLLKRFDYEIHDYTEPTTTEFFNIFDVSLKGANTKSEGEGTAINYISEALYYIAQSRRELTIVGAKIVNLSAWLVLVVLSMLIVFSLFLMRDGTVESALITALLAASAVLSLFVLADVDGNRFGEEQFAVDTYQDVFSAIGQLHYYPDLYLEAGRYKPSVKTYRAGKSDSIRIVNTESKKQ